MNSNEKQTVSVNIGNKNQGNISVAGDIKVKINPDKYTPEFVTPPFNEFEENIYIIPISAPSLAAMTMREKFLVLGGDGYDKTRLARYISWIILKEHQCINSENTIEVKEWTNTADAQNFITALQTEDKPTIFIFPDISPHHIRYNPSGLYRVTRDNNHYLIVTTDDPLEKWKLEKDLEKLFWQPSGPLYDPGNLFEVLTKKLVGTLQELPEELRKMEFKPDSILMGSLPLQEIAIRLKTPDSIDTFVKGLASLKSPLKVEDIRELLEASQDDRKAIKRWFLGTLSPRERLITLGLCLFDGFSDDQFFAAMEELFEQSWRKMNPSQEALDYCDLDSLCNYYKLIDLEKEGKIKKVKSVLVNQQQILLKIAWETHRRHILSALPVMEQLVKKSVSPGFLNPELCGTMEHQNRIRGIISETFCTLGLISMDSIEGNLLSLAAKEELEVQVVVARTMAQWRYYKRDKELFDTLHTWKVNATYRQMLASFLDNKDTQAKEQKNPLVYIKATIALTVGFAAAYDTPNRLNDKLVDLLIKLADDTENTFIYSRFSNYTLPLVVRFHARQLRDMLWEMTTLYHWLNEPVGASLALAYQESPQEVQEILESWYHSSRAPRNRSSLPQEINDREAVLATVAFAYGWMQYNEEKGPITGDTGFKCLHQILEKEINLHVRKAAVSAVTRQTQFNFKKTGQYLKKLFSCMYKNEIQQVIDRLVTVHLEQRKAFEEGDDYFEWKEQIYYVWVNREQPLTDVEEVMREWIKDSDNPKSQQVAFRFMHSKELVDFQEKEKRFVDNLVIDSKQEEEPVKDNNQVYPVPSFDIDTDYSTFSIWFASWLVSLRENEYMKIIRGLLPEALKQNISHRDILDFVLEKMQKDPDDEIKKIAEKLKWALSIARKAKHLIFGMILLLIIIIYLIFK